MSNRKKSRREKRDKFLAKIKGETGLDVGMKVEGRVITPPQDEKVLLKTVPAVIHWKEWEAVDREDDEVIGVTNLYEDGSFDMIIDRDISQEAKAFANSLQRQNPGAFSLADFKTKED